MNENELIPGEELSLFDLWETLLVGWRFIAGGVFIGLLVAVLAVLLMQPKYEAVAVLQVGQVGQVGQVSSLPVEPATQAIERMKTPSFQMTVAQALGDKEWLDKLKNSSGISSEYLSLQIIKATVGQTSSPLIELKAKSNSSEGARKIADASVVELAKRHMEIAKPTIERMQSDLAIAKEKRQRAENDLESLGKLVSGAGVKDERFTQLSLMTSLRLQKESELFAQRQMVTALESALSPPLTQPAHVIESTFVSEKPVSPKKGLLLTLGLFGGLLMGALAAFMVPGWYRARAAKGC